MPTIQEFSTKDKVELSGLVFSTSSEILAQSLDFAEIFASSPSAKALSYMKGLSRLSIFLGVAGAAMNIAMAFLPSETEELLAMTKELNDKLDELGENISSSVSDISDEILQAIQFASFDEARTRIAHTEQMMDRYLHNYNALTLGYVTASQSLVGWYNPAGTAENSITYEPSLANQWRSLKTFKPVPSYVDPSSLATLNIPYLNFQEGSNTVYVHCSNVGGQGGFISSFCSYENGDGADDFNIVRYDTNITDWEILTPGAVIDLQQAMAATGWKTPTSYGVYSHDTAPWIDDVVNMPATNAEWLWDSNSATEEAWFRCTFTYNKAAQQNLESYFKNVQKANIKNYVSDLLAEDIFRIIVNATNYDHSVQESTLDMVRRQSNGNMNAVFAASNMYLHMVQRGLKALAFVRGVKEEVTFLDSRAVDYAYQLSAADQSLLLSNMNYLQFGIDQMFNHQDYKKNLIGKFVQKVNEAITATASTKQFETQVRRMLSNNLKTLEDYINSKDDENTINKNIASFIGQQLFNSYTSEGVTAHMFVLVCENLGRTHPDAGFEMASSFKENLSFYTLLYWDDYDRIIMIAGKNIQLGIPFIVNPGLLGQISSGFNNITYPFKPEVAIESFNNNMNQSKTYYGASLSFLHEQRVNKRFYTFTPDVHLQYWSDQASWVQEYNHSMPNRVYEVFKQIVWAH
jgi:hypothetical protein